MAELSNITADFARGLEIADYTRPQASNRTRVFQPGIGPHTEDQTVAQVFEALSNVEPYDSRYDDRYDLHVAYPDDLRRKCHLCLGKQPFWEWAIEVKMIRMLGDNGRPNDNMVMHLLSPYPKHNSALTDCEKLGESGFTGRKAVLIYGYDHDKWPLDPMINSFETLARARHHLGPQHAADFDNLVHPIHARGRVFAWQLLDGAESTRGAGAVT